jgi:glycerol uptake facilitator-like aquaporin
MRAIVAEGIGTALLVAAVVGSGIMGERLAGGNMALALLANSIATGAVLVTLIFTFAPISGAHFNPAVSLAAALEGGFPWRCVPGYIGAQLAGAVAGVVAAHAMFEHPLIVLSQHARVGFAQLFSEFLATFGLLVVIHGTGKRAAVVPLTVAAYITAAYWFTSSTSFANPRCDGRAWPDGHVLRHRPSRNSGLHRGATCRSARGDAALPMARSRLRGIAS